MPDKQSPASRLIEADRQYIVYDSNGKVIIITTNKRIAEHYANNT
jgi:hypothetical protein